MCPNCKRYGFDPGNGTCTICAHGRRSSVPAAEAEALLRRLGARGTWELRPRRRGFELTWWPRGQGPARRGGGNPFCQRTWVGATLRGVAGVAEHDTRPPSRSLDALVTARAGRDRIRETMLTS